MTYALLGKIFAAFIVFVVVWIGTWLIAIFTAEDPMHASFSGPFAFQFLGPILGLIAAVVAWIWILPTYQ